jgi:hypothetical protein
LRRGSEDDLKQIFAFKHGAPSHNTFSRVFRLLDPEELVTVLPLPQKDSGRPRGRP